MMNLYGWLLFEDACTYYRSILDRSQESQSQTVSSLLTELVVELIQAEIIGALDLMCALLMLKNKRCNALCSYEYGVGC